ncbi:YdcH family protein [Rouxiella sp. Mn2063]|uniref:YdcH family protein n=1 Tax=Rouxiella sp. Mn2063 TaxID=3395262 RepID=UPI003BDBAC95
MFPEYRELISHLKSSHPRFQSLFDKHNQLDHQIARLEGPTGNGYNDNVVQLKKEKLHIKDCLYKILLEESPKQS